MTIDPPDHDTRFGRRATPVAWVVLAPLLLWLVAFVVAPTLCMIIASFCQRDNLGQVVFHLQDADHGGPFGNYIAVFSAREVLIQACVVLASTVVAFLALLSFRAHLAGLATILLGVIAGAACFEGYWQFRSTTALIVFASIFAVVLLALMLLRDEWISLPARNPVSSAIITWAACWWVGSNVLYVHNFDDVLYLQTLILSINYAGISTVVCVLAGYPVAYFIGKAPERFRNILLMGVMIPFWTSFLVRTYAWVTIFRSEGVLNSVLGYAGNLGVKLHLLTALPEWLPLDLYPSQFAVMVGLIYTYLPFMILPIYGSVEKLDNALVEAAFDLGASPVRAFSRVIFPLTQPGIMAGILLVFVPAVGMFAINDILGGHKEMLIGNVIEQQFRAARNPPFGAALGMVLLLTFVLIYYFATRRRGGAVG